jgi:deoxyribodipyrimidine photolyase-related protein
MAKTLRLILGDQLNPTHSWFDRRSSDITYLMMEILPETQYVTHHIQKILAIFMAMRCFATEMQNEGHHFIYITLDDPENRQSFEENIERLIERHGYSTFEYQQPDEYRLDRLFSRLAKDLTIQTQMYDSEHFITPRNAVAEFFKGRKTYRMESFYRHLRRQKNILMDKDQPLTGQWNYDQDNRKSLPTDETIPDPLLFDNDARKIAETLNRLKVQTIGASRPRHLIWPISQQQSLALLDHFLTSRLQKFGTYQDALTHRDDFLFHSRLSFALNTKQLTLETVIKKSIEYWQRHQDTIHISQIEGFVRQLLGWREYMRGLYWCHMPDYEQMNTLEHRAPLPEFYWTGNTRMACMAHAIRQSLDQAYAHHIQRLMVTGNFALLAGVHPDETDAWYLGIYIDAFQWVEITNTRGMSQYADGGMVGSKPYVSSANYINRMSDYCNHCYYQADKKYGERSCPFNSLYWDFFYRHRERLQTNPRVSVMYRTWDRMNPDDRKHLLDHAARLKQEIQSL